jgi:hypothetical protein
MKHIHFVIYRLKSIIYCYFNYLLFYFFIICIYSEIEFIKPFNDVKIQHKTITFTKRMEDRTVFINKMINSGIMRMFTSFYNFYISIFYSQVLCICANNYSYFSMRNIFLFCNDFIFFYFII